VLNNRLALILVTALAPAIWGTTYLVTTEFLPPGRPLLAAVIRALPAGLLLVALTRRLPQGDWWWRSLVLGTLNIGAFLALLFVAAYRLPGGVAATLGALQPLIVAGLSTGLLGERLNRRTVLAGVAGVLGVSLLVLQSDARLDALGVAAAAGGAVVMATGVVLSKRWTSPAPLLATTGWQLVAGGLVLVPVALAVEGAPPPALSGANLAGYGYLALIGAALAYALWFRGIRALAATHVTFLGLLSPVVATLLGWLVLGQRLTAWQLLGAAIVLAAVVFAQRRTGRRQPATPPLTTGVSPSHAHAGTPVLDGTGTARPLTSTPGCPQATSSTTSTGTTNTAVRTRMIGSPRFPLTTPTGHTPSAAPAVQRLTGSAESRPVPARRCDLGGVIMEPCGSRPGGADSARGDA
jgi:probable blue pigment (indigoidine) exporter